ncbi:ABC transporter substrate-binding protein [Halarcobacter ebronensis]|uniref:ABC transporter substrate-binding protein n=1 Tax=Halarcobacter ebronensis TaxID=1462615 RepID=A0A4Q1AMQ0_9BACT|nr:ABC transporter substrate-binding protein [Halarcobacter ebronensis]QKF82765.1 ABC transporter, periplasmic substrate-binding protein [Halarcobacter ebronensis]RXK06790.1 ABC transporter substrate-binding protein [Halarcobacter ebronensis]
MKKLVLFLLVLDFLYSKDNLTIFGASPPATYFLYSINPKLIAGTNYAFRDKELLYLKEEMRSLPIIGGWYGQGKTPNFETLIKVNPDLVVTWNYNNGFKQVNEKINSLGFKTFEVNLSSLKDYVKVYDEIGKALFMEERTKLLSEYTKTKLEEIENLQKKIKMRKSVYYAEGTDGLLTECDKSIHADLIEYIGAENPHKCSNKMGFGRDRISLEQLLLYNPDVIITQEQNFYNNIYKNEKFKDIKAVKNKEVYLIPSSPFSWFDRPPSFMKILGAQWLGNLVYKDIYSFNINSRVKEFYRLFLDVSLDDEKIINLLKGE